MDAFEAVGARVIGLGHADVDVVDAGSVASVTTEAAPDLVVNTTAFHQVDKCEEEPATAEGTEAQSADSELRARDPDDDSDQED